VPVLSTYISPASRCGSNESTRRRKGTAVLGLLSGKQRQSVHSAVTTAFQWTNKSTWSPRINRNYSPKDYIISICLYTS